MYVYFKSVVYKCTVLIVFIYSMKITCSSIISAFCILVEIVKYIFECLPKNRYSFRSILTVNAYVFNNLYSMNDLLISLIIHKRKKLIHN